MGETGRRINFFQTGTVLKKDIFSYLPTKDLWVDHEWGSGVVFYLFAKLFGEWGIFLIKALIIFSIFLLIAKIIQLQINRYPGIFFFLFLCFSLLPGIGGLVRCQMFTYLFLHSGCSSSKGSEKKKKPSSGYSLFPCYYGSTCTADLLQELD